MSIPGVLSSRLARTRTHVFPRLPQRTPARGHRSAGRRIGEDRDVFPHARRRKGAVYIQNGQITHAKVNDVEGEDAIYALALWNEGQFQFSAGVESETRTITRSNTNLLMEAARRSDEWKILSKKIPTTEAVPQLVCREGLSEPVTLTPNEWLVVTGIDGARTIEEIARATRLSAFDVAKTLYGLITAELVEIRTKAEARPAAPLRPGGVRARAGFRAGRHDAQRRLQRRHPR